MGNPQSEDWPQHHHLGFLLALLPEPVSERKLRLLTAACGRRIWHLLADDRAQELVRATERYADGEITARELAAVRQAAGSGAWPGGFHPRFEAVEAG